MSNDLIELIRLMNEKPIAFNKHYVFLGCGINGAVMLSQLVYWADKAKDQNGWIYKTSKEWTEETGLTRREQDTARKNLKELGFIEEHKHGVPCKVHYKVNQSALYSALINLAQKRQTDAQISQTDAQKRQTNTESTTNNTTENTFINKAKVKFDPLLVELPSNVDRQDWIEFVKMRKLIKKPLTELATSKILKKLSSFGIHAKQALENSIVSSWSDVYLPKQQSSYSTPQSRQTPSMADYMQQEMMRDVTPDYQQNFLEHKE